MKGIFSSFLSFIMLMITASASYGQGPNLGAASTFALFTANGAVDNAGANTYIVGDVGTNSGASTGFSAASIVGQTHVADAVSSQAALDIISAYNSLTNEPCTPGSATATTLGGGQTLPPATYCLGGATSVVGTLILDGQNNANSLFIFKINGALTTDVTTQVVLINAASAKNIYWRVSGAADFAANSTFAGTIIASGAIGLANEVLLMGRTLSTTGAISTNNNRVTSPGATPMPVELTEFTAEAQAGRALLRWTTASEKNNAYFAIESSADGRTFVRQGHVAGQGTSAQPHAYTWTDARPAATPAAYYRLRQVDNDSTATYSPVRLVRFAAAATLQLQAYPNPFQQQLRVQIDVAQAASATLWLTDALGQLLMQRTLALTAGSNAVTLDEAPALRPGRYFVYLRQGAQRQTLSLVRE